MTLAKCYHGHGSDAKCDEANPQMLSRSLQQLVQLTAHLLLALPLDARHHLAQSLLQVSAPSSSTLGQHLSYFLPLVQQGQTVPSTAARTDVHLMPDCIYDVIRAFVQTYCGWWNI